MAKPRSPWPCVTWTFFGRWCEAGPSPSAGCMAKDEEVSNSQSRLELWTLGKFGWRMWGKYTPWQFNTFGRCPLVQPSLKLWLDRSHRCVEDTLPCQETKSCRFRCVCRRLCVCLTASLYTYVYIYISYIRYFINDFIQIYAKSGWYITKHVSSICV